MTKQQLIQRQQEIINIINKMSNRSIGGKKYNRLAIESQDIYELIKAAA